VVQGTPADRLFTVEEEFIVTSTLDLVRQGTDASLSETDSDCTNWIVTGGSRSRERPIDQLLEKSVAAFTGTVLNEASGFYRGVPKTLYGIEVDRYLKLPSEMNPPGDRLWVPYGQVEMEVDGLKLCVRGPSFPGTPTVGGRVLAFVHEFDQANPQIARVFEASLFFEDAEGRVWLPGSGNVVDRPDWEVVERLLEGLAAGTGGGD
jgi:hypothetical protein